MARTVAEFVAVQMWLRALPWIQNRSRLNEEGDVTAQTPDSIEIDNQAWFLRSTPLQPLVAEVPFVASRTDLRRGYVPKWRFGR